MIFDAIIIMGTVWINMLVFALKQLDPFFSFTHFDEVINFILITPLSYLSGVFDTETFLQALTILASWYGALFAFKWIVWLYNWIPFMGQKQKIKPDW